MAACDLYARWAQLSDNSEMAENLIYLTVDKDPKGRGLLAIVTQGSPQFGDKEVTVLTLEVVSDMDAAYKWYDRMLVERPWIVRS